MNKVYKVIFNISKGMLEVVSELAGSKACHSVNVPKNIGIDSGVHKFVNLLELSCIAKVVISACVLPMVSLVGVYASTARAELVYSAGNNDKGYGIAYRTWDGKNPVISKDCLGCFAFGQSSQAAGDDKDSALAIGSISYANKGSSAIGEASKANKYYTIAYGYRTEANADRAIALGSRAKANALDSISVGTNSLSDGVRSLVLGSSAYGSGDNSFAIGYKSKAQAESAISFGVNSIASEKQSIAMGVNAESKVKDGVAIGTNSVANTVAGSAPYIISKAGSDEEKELTLQEGPEVVYRLVEVM